MKGDLDNQNFQIGSLMIIWLSNNYLTYTLISPLEKLFFKLLFLYQYHTFTAVIINYIDL